MDEIKKEYQTSQNTVNITSAVNNRAKVNDRIDERFAAQLSEMLSPEYQLEHIEELIEKYGNEAAKMIARTIFNKDFKEKEQKLFNLYNTNKKAYIKLIENALLTGSILSYDGYDLVKPMYNILSEEEKSKVINSAIKKSLETKNSDKQEEIDVNSILNIVGSYNGTIAEGNEELTKLPADCIKPLFNAIFTTSVFDGLTWNGIKIIFNGYCADEGKMFESVLKTILGPLAYKENLDRIKPYLESKDYETGFEDCMFIYYGILAEREEAKNAFDKQASTDIYGNKIEVPKPDLPELEPIEDNGIVNY